MLAFLFLLFLYITQSTSTSRKHLLRSELISSDTLILEKQDIPNVINNERLGGHHNAHESWKHLFNGQFGEEFLQSDARFSTSRSLQATPIIQLNETTINHKGVVQVTAYLPASLVTTFGKLAYVALYTPVTSNLSLTTPIRYQLCTLDKEFNAAVLDGKKDAIAKFSFKLNNLHTGGYVAYLISGGLSGSVAGKGTTSTVKGTDTSWPFGTTGTAVKGGSKPWVSLTGLVGAQDSTSRSSLSVNTFYGTVLAKSSTMVLFKKPNEPTGLRITPSSTLSSYFSVFRFSWNQNSESTGGYIKYKSISTSNWAIVTATSSKITIDDVCSRGPASTTGFREMGTIYTAEVDLSLLAGTTIMYIVGDSTDNTDVSSPLIFQVPLLPGQSLKTNNNYNNNINPQHWIIYADQGVGFDDDSFEGRNYNTGWGARAVARSVSSFIRANANGIQGLVISGDASYSDGYLAQWLEWFEMMSLTLSRTILLISSGNHENDWMRNEILNYDSPSGKTLAQDSSYWSTLTNPANSISSGGECGIAFKLLPINKATPSMPWYSYTAGMATWVVISTEHNLRPESLQYIWLSSTLASVNRITSPWLFITGHRSMYVFTSNMCGSSNCSNWNPNDSSTDFKSESGWASDEQVNLYLQAFVEPLMIKYRVNFFFSGHTHVTQRYCAVANGKCKQNSTFDPSTGFNVYENPLYPIGMTIGNAGASTSNDGVSEFKSNGGKYPLFHSWFTLDLSYAVISIISSTEMNILVYNAFSGQVIDRSKIIQANRISTDNTGSGSETNGWIIAIITLTVFGVIVGGIKILQKIRKLFRTDMIRL